MSLSETKTIDQIIVNDLGCVQYREAARVFKDNVEISKTYHVTVLSPGQDLTGHPSNVAAVANAAWTPEILAAAQQREQELIAQATA